MHEDEFGDEQLRAIITGDTSSGEYALAKALLAAREIVAGKQDRIDELEKECATLRDACEVAERALDDDSGRILGERDMLQNAVDRLTCKVSDLEGSLADAHRIITSLRRQGGRR